MLFIVFGFNTEIILFRLFEQEFVDFDISSLDSQKVKKS